MPWWTSLAVFGVAGVLGVDQIRRGRTALGSGIVAVSAYAGYLAYKTRESRKEVESDKLEYRRAVLDKSGGMRSVVAYRRSTSGKGIGIQYLSRFNS